MTDLTKTRHLALYGALAALIVGGVAHSFAAGTHEHGHGHQTGEPGKADDMTRTVEVYLYDNYYEPEEIDVQLGETIRFKLINNGEFVHEFNIGTPEMHAEHQDEMMMMVEHGVLESDKINHDMMDMDMGSGHVMSHDDPNSMLMEPGDVAEIIWTFSADATLEFACNVPGHYDSGMVGMFRISR